MSKKLFVGGLSWNTTSEELRDAFAACGDVVEAKVITDREGLDPASPQLVYRLGEGPWNTVPLLPIGPADTFAADAENPMTLFAYLVDFIAGAFTNADPVRRQRAIDLTKRGLDECREAGGAMLTLWLGQDGIDHPFEADYGQLWELEVSAIAEVAEYASDFPVSIEPKPNEPKAISVLPNIAATLLAIDEAGAPNLGVTIDFAHILQADESATTDEEYVGRIYLEKLLVRMLATALRRNRSDCSFNEFQQRLLHAFARYVPRDGWVVGLP